MAAACATAVSVICGVAQSAADPIIRDEHKTVLFSSGFDLWRHGGFAYGGAVWSPNGLEREGLSLKAFLGSGTYRYTAAGARITGQALVASILPGWRFARERMTLTLAGGLDAQHHRLTPLDPNNRLRGGHFGFRAAAELWWEPSAATAFDASASMSTIGTGYWTRAAFGWRAMNLFYAGPEMTALGDDSYRQFRIGAHLTALRAGPFEWSAGAGWSRDSDRRSGPYARVGLLARN